VVRPGRGDRPGGVSHRGVLADPLSRPVGRGRPGRDLAPPPRSPRAAPRSPAGRHGPGPSDGVVPGDVLV